MQTIELPAVVLEHIEELTALCREYGVARLEIFGSAVSGEFNPATSDLDFLVTYPPGYDFGPWGARWQELEERIAELYGRPVDFIFAQEFRNPYFASSVNESRRLVYAA